MKRRRSEDFSNLECKRWQTIILSWGQSSNNYIVDNIIDRTEAFMSFWTVAWLFCIESVGSPRLFPSFIQGRGAFQLSAVIIVLVWYPWREWIDIQTEYQGPTLLIEAQTRGTQPTGTFGIVPVIQLMSPLLHILVLRIHFTDKALHLIMCVPLESCWSIN